MDTVCEFNKCCGCMGCINVCAASAIKVIDNLKGFNASINKDICIGCNQCYNICPQNNEPEYYSPLWWYQGWANSDLRDKGSSGGVASAVSKAFISSGGCVASCYYRNGEFLYKIIDKDEEVEEFCGSKYVKSNPGNIYTLIQERIKNQKVLFIGLPCHVAALKRVIKKEWSQNLFTIDIICHGTPSSYILELFLKDYNLLLSQIESINFRVKNDSNVSSNARKLVPNGMRDEYTTGFLRGLFYTDNCYYCKYACKNRIGDVTLGDSWGSELENEEKEKGISLILIQNEKGKEIINKADLTLRSVMLDKAIAANQQLVKPSIMPAKRDKFFSKLEQGKRFKQAFFSCYKKDCVKWTIKKILIKITGGGKASQYQITISLKR